MRVFCHPAILPFECAQKTYTYNLHLTFYILHEVYILTPSIIIVSAAAKTCLSQLFLMPPTAVTNACYTPMAGITININRHFHESCKAS